MKTEHFKWDRDESEEFLSQALDKWDRGITEYRDGDPSKPFVGNPLLEAIEETYDLYGYGLEAWRNGDVTELEVSGLFDQVFSLYVLIKGYIERGPGGKVS